MPIGANGQLTGNPRCHPFRPAANDNETQNNVLRCAATSCSQCQSYQSLSSTIRPVPDTSEVPVQHSPSSFNDRWSDSENRDILCHRNEFGSDFSID